MYSMVWKSQIVRCESDSNYTKIVLTGSNSPLIVSRTLKYVESNYLNTEEFVRTHKSHLINIRYLISKSITSSSIQLNNGDIIPVSRSKRELVKDVIKKLR